MHELPEPHSVRRILLPSGRTVDVVRFFDDEVSQPGLHICSRCGSELVQPVDWSESTSEHWELTLECPNCRWVQTGTYGREQVEALEESLDQGLSNVLEDLRRLAQVNMSEEVCRFAAALQADVILPEDF